MWQPISEYDMDKDGFLVLIAFEINGEKYVRLGFYSVGTWYAETLIKVHPTHFQPLPEHPEE